MNGVAIPVGQVRMVNLRNGWSARVMRLWPGDAARIGFSYMGIIAENGEVDFWAEGGTWRENGQAHPRDLLFKAGEDRR